MQRMSLSALLLTVTALSLLYYKFGQVNDDIRAVQHNIFKMLKDLESRALIADGQLEQRVVDKVRENEDNLLERESKQIQTKAAATAEAAIMMRIEEFAKTLSAKSATNQSHSSAQIDLSTLALVKEYVYKYITMDIPIDVKRWYTYVRKQVQRLNLLEQDDPLLIQFIREQLLVPPFIKEPESKAKKKPGNYSKDISSFLEIFRNKEKGFFVEIGNNFTKSQIFEADFSWEGVLIDKDPDSVNKLLDKKRKAWIVPTCLSLKSTPEMVIFVNTTRKEANREIIEIHCMPINTIFASLNISRVDYLHLDVHGRENEAFTRLNLTSFPVHVVEIGKSADQKEKNLLKKHLESAAFKLLALKNETDRLIYVNPANAK